MLSRWISFCRDERGATAIEYAVIAAFLSIAIAAGVRQIGLDVVALLQQAIDALSA